MRKKIFIQILLFLSIILLFFLIYQIYFKNTSEEKSQIMNQKKEAKENSLINIAYESVDASGKKYVINAESGTFDSNKPEIIFMSNVRAKIILLDESTIYINSLEAEYNNVNYDTKFKKKINLKFLENEIFCNNLNIFFKDNLLEAYNDLTYKNSDIIMIADKVEIDLLNKNSKIFNFNENKVQIKTKETNGNN